MSTIKLEVVKIMINNIPFNKIFNNIILVVSLIQSFDINRKINMLSKSTGSKNIE